MYSLEDIEKKLGVKSYVIRFWENNFSQISTTFENDNERVYTEDDFEILKRIHKYLYEENSSIEEVQAKLNSGGSIINQSYATREAVTENKPIPEEKALPANQQDFLVEVKNKLDEILKILRSSL